MKTEQVNIRLEADLAAALDRMADVESLDRTTAARRLLESSLRQWQVDRAIRDYQTGASSIGRAAEEAGLSQWEILDAARAAQVAHPSTAEDVRRRLEPIVRSPDTLPDIPPAAGGVLLVGINPAPVSVAAGHYYQGKLGRRLWRRLERVGLLRDPVPGAEDEAFATAGHGLTDIVKRPTPSSKELTRTELERGAGELREKIAEWTPGLVLFASREPAVRLLGSHVKPGRCGEIAGVPAFLLSGPYAPSVEGERIDGELQQLLGLAEQTARTGELTQRVTKNDLVKGQIRLPRPAKRFFPSAKGKVEIVLRGTRATATYDPRLGPDRERSAVLRVGPLVRELVEPGSRLVVRQGVGGAAVLE
ncbi:MAG: uracil-DNA glycosylase family protein [Gaiellaceae bacterium]